MKRIFWLASTFALLAGCTSNPNYSYRGNTGPMGGTDAGYGIGVAPNQQGAGAVRLGNAQLTSDEVDFIRRATQDNLADIQLGQAMIQKSDSGAVRDLGQRLVGDHTAMNQQLKAIIAQKGVTVPVTPTAEQQQWLDDCSSRSGPDFNSETVRHAAQHQEHEASAYQAVADSSTDPEIHIYATKNLPLIKQDLTEARQIESPVPASTPVYTLPPPPSSQ